MSTCESVHAKSELSLHRYPWYRESLQMASAGISCAVSLRKLRARSPDLGRAELGALGKAMEGESLK